MRNFFRSPLFRCLVCLILVCCILVNVSPIRAKAFGGLSSAALIYLLYAAAAGAVIIPSSITIANSIGKKVDEEVEITFDQTLIDWYNQLTNYQDNLVPEWDPNEWNDILKHGLAGGLLALISSMMVELVVEGAIHMTEKDLSDGSWLMDSITYKIFSSSTISSSLPFCAILYSYRIVNKSTSFGILCCSGSTRPTISTGSVTQYNGYYFFGSSTSSGYDYNIPSMTSTPFVPYIDFGTFSSESDANEKRFDFMIDYYNNGQTITIEPDIYVGDLPDEIRDGEKDEENLNLPIIDPFKIIKSPETAFEDVTQTLQELKDGVITYDEYIEKVTADDPTIDPDPSTPTEPGEDPEEDPEEIAPYTFDLRDIFPFCIPFDLYDFLTCLDATPVAPVIHWEIQMPGGGSYPLNLDLSPFDSVAQLLRRLELLVFSIALAIKTRDLIKG